MRPSALMSMFPASIAGRVIAPRSEEANPRGANFQTAVESLSQRLRRETAALHQEIERRLNLPESITNMDRYLTFLASFFRLYRPLEGRLKTFKQWSKIGISLEERLQSPRLAQDLSALGIAPVLIEDAPEDSLPALHSFAHALGALYVMEGLTLEAPFHLRHLQQSLGVQLTGATAFLGAHGASTGERWNSFTRCLDAHGPLLGARKVIQGASDTLQAIGEWVAYGTGH